MFDGGGGLIAEMMRARILMKLAEAKPWRRVLGVVGDALIAAGGWLKARVQPLPAAQAGVEFQEQHL